MGPLSPDFSLEKEIPDIQISADIPPQPPAARAPRAAHASQPDPTAPEAPMRRSTVPAHDKGRGPEKPTSPAPAQVQEAPPPSPPPAQPTAQISVIAAATTMAAPADPPEGGSQGEERSPRPRRHGPTPPERQDAPPPAEVTCLWRPELLTTIG